ncbi:Arabinose-proton symporter [Paramyrothecium foliicola]|nr:Arabinose-proton symporter [Paramyrothecium foliicola]
MSTAHLEVDATAGNTARGNEHAADMRRYTTTSTMINPLSGLTKEEILADVDVFVEEHGLEEHLDTFRKGALVAKTQNIPGSFEIIEELSEQDKQALRFEADFRWRSSPKRLYMLAALCAGCAIVQGMDQTVINGAQDYYFDEFGIKDRLMQGFVNGSPYAASALVGCWLNAPLNNRWGRRGTIAFSCFLACVTAFWQAACSSWISLLCARLVLGLAVGAKSSTTPVYAAECAPKSIRGALTMMWQMWTAFGIMLGFVVSLVFQHVDFLGPNSQWRWMLGITGVPPMLVGAFIYCMPESPRWYMDKQRFGEAYVALRKLRKSDIQASRDMYLAYKFLEVEQAAQSHKTKWDTLREFFTVRRNIRAAQSAWFCMIMQQFCGVNVIAYYSTKIFVDAGFSRDHALLISFGTGACNFLGAIPAVFTIDRFGRRGLLLCTFPAMAFFLFLAGFAFKLEDDQTRLPLLAVSLYLFMLIYSPGLGPVPFTYSAEAFPLHIRAVGMSSATAITWAFNFVISLTWPEMMNKLTTTGGFCWYAAWNIFGWVFTWFLLPETKNRTLEELDGVFSMRNRDHARYHAQYLRWSVGKMSRKNVGPMPPLYEVQIDGVHEEPKQSDV